MWEVFENMVNKGYTVRRIRLEMRELDFDLDKFDDADLLKKMIRILRNGN